MSTRTRTEILSQVRLDNIVQYTLSQTTLESNFKAIVEALHEHDEDISKTDQRVSQNSEKIDMVSERTEKLEKGQSQMKDQIEELRNMIMKLNAKNKDGNSESNKSGTLSASKVENPEKSAHSSSSSNEVSNLNNQLKDISEKMAAKQSQNQRNITHLMQQLEKLKKDLAKASSSASGSSKDSSQEKILNELKQQMHQVQQDSKDHSKRLSELESFVTASESELENKLDEMRRQMMEQLQKFISDEYSPNKQSTWKKIEELEEAINANTNILNEEKRLRNKLSEELWKMKDNGIKSQQLNMLNQLNSDSIKQLKKDISDLHKKINELTMKNQLSADRSTTIHDTVSNFDATNNKNRSHGASDGSLEDLRDQMIERLKDQRNQLLKAIRKMEQKGSEGTDGDKNRINALEEQVLRLNHLMGEKADIGTVKKMLSFIENKITYIFNLVSGGKGDEDALIGRKNWFCMSCDGKLDRYQGRVGSHLPTSQFKSKTLDQDTIGGGMTLRPSKSKMELPQVKTNISGKKL